MLLHPLVDLLVERGVILGPAGLGPGENTLSAGGYLAELDRMNLALRQCFLLHPSEVEKAAWGLRQCPATGLTGRAINGHVRMNWMQLRKLFEGGRTRRY